MGITNAQKRKAAKKKARERKIRKATNIKRNQAPYRYRLDVLVDGEWAVGVVRFKDPAGVKGHVQRTEARRRAGEEIAQGKVIDEETGKTVLEIPGSKPKGTLPDVIADGPKADPNVTAAPAESPAAEEVPKEGLTEVPESR